ncbi:MAG: hypothetical protein WEA80_13050 [Gemmatimonadaceae bacterium]
MPRKIPTWAAEGAVIWKEQVRRIALDHFVKAMKPMVEQYGWPRARAAMLTYCELNANRVRKIEFLAADAVRWIGLSSMPVTAGTSGALREAMTELDKAAAQRSA